MVSADFKKEKGQKDYAVPDFGKDHDMESTEKHLADTEERLGHKWKPEYDEDDKKFIVP